MTANHHAIRGILVPTDWSACSTAALRVALDIAKQQQSRLWIAHVVETTTLDLELASAAVAGLEAAEQHMRCFLGNADLDSIPFRTLIQAGDLWPVLSRIAEDHQVDLIVAGTHGHNGLRRAMIGSTAETIVRNAECPVMTVSSAACPSASILRIVFPTDLSDATVHALPYALGFANENNAQLVFVHVLNGAPGAPADYPDDVAPREEQYAEAMSRLRQLLPDEMRFRRVPELVLACDVPADGVLKVAGRMGADLIMMPVHHRTVATRSRRAWTTVSRVVAHAPCPVLTLAV